MFIGRFLKGTDSTKFRNAVISYKDIARDKAGNQWSLGKPEGVCLEDFWAFWNTNVIGCYDDDTTAEDSCINLDQALWFMLGRSSHKKHLSMFGEHIYYVRNDIQNPFKIGILKYADNVNEMFAVDKLLPPLSRNNEDYHESAYKKMGKPF